MTRWRKKLCLLAVLTAFGLPSIKAQAGEIVQQSFSSAALGGPLAALVYKPDGTAPDGGWPVLYLLHGHGGDETSWRDLGNIKATLDGMIGTGEIAAQIVVMPGVGDSWYVDSADLGGPGNYETAIVHDLRKAVEAHYDVRKDRGGRAIAGLSMGGFGALRLALAHPDLYVASVALSPGLWQNIPQEQLHLAPEAMALIIDSTYFHHADPTNVTQGVDLPPAPPYFGKAYGSPFDGLRYNSRNVFTLLAQRLEAGDPLPALYVTVGDDDSHKLWRGAIALYETMKAADKPIEFRITDGDHVWPLWQETIQDGLRFIHGQWGTSAHP